MFDLTIRNCTIVDGTGLPRYHADIGIVGNRIAKIGRLSERGNQDIDANSLVVSPGFIDGHTHMDAQIFWDPLGTSSCWHGVTTVVMGNCGFTLAPAKPGHRHFIASTLERAEDISAATMQAGVPWNWDNFRSYLHTIDGLPKGINYAANVGHSALRIWAMGERAFDQPATAADMASMEHELRDALSAGAIGFTTSRARHEMSDGRPVASRVAEWQEIEHLVTVMGEMGCGLFEFAENFRSTSPEEQARDLARFGDLAVKSGVPVTFGILSSHENPRGWRDRLDLIDSTTSRGGRMFGQCHAREISVLMSFRTQLPFDVLDEWKQFRSRPLDEQRRALSDRRFRDGLVHAAHHGKYSKLVGAEPRKLDFSSLFVIRNALPGAHSSVAEIALQRQVDPVDAMIDLSLETNFEQFFFQPVSNVNLDDVADILQHPRTIMTFSDSGAHVSQIMDSSIHSTFLAYWVRERQLFTLEDAVRMITLAPARAWGLHDRGLIREGMVADLNIFDPETIRPDLPQVARDLPGNGVRLTQKCSGIHATVVSGKVMLKNGEHTGLYPGKLLRGPLAGR